MNKDCGAETYIDISSAKARRYRQTCHTTPPDSAAVEPPKNPSSASMTSKPSVLPSQATASSNTDSNRRFGALESTLSYRRTRNVVSPGTLDVQSLSPVDTFDRPPLLPTQKAAPSNSGKNQGLRASVSTVLKMAFNMLFLPLLRKTGNKSIFSTVQLQHNPSVIDTPEKLTYLHWCVDSASSKTIVHHICVEQKNGKDFLNDLHTSYRKLRGWRWYLSMTTCAEIKLVRVSHL